MHKPATDTPSPALFVTGIESVPIGDSDGERQAILDTLEDLTPEQSQALGLVFKGLGNLLGSKAASETKTQQFFQGIESTEGQEVSAAIANGFQQASIIAHVVGNSFLSEQNIKVSLEALQLHDGDTDPDNTVSIAAILESPTTRNTAQENLRLIQEGSGLSKTAIATTLGVSGETVRTWIHGRAVRERNQARIADFAALIHLLKEDYEIPPSKVKDFLRTNFSYTTADEPEGMDNLLGLYQKGYKITVLDLVQRKFQP